MSRQVGETYIAAVNAAETSEAILVLLTLTDYFGTKFRFTNNSVDVISRGETFLTYPFDITLPTSEDNRISTANLSFDNVSRTLIDEIRAQAYAFKVQIEVVLSSDTNVVVAAWKGYEWRALSYDATRVSGTLTLESYANEPYPGKIMSAQGFPGLFFL